MKTKYNIGDVLYYYDEKEKRVKSFTVEEIEIRKYGCRYIYHDLFEQPIYIYENFVQPSLKKLCKKVLGEDFIRKELIELIGQTMERNK